MNLYPTPAAVVATNRQPHVVHPLGTTGLNSGSVPRNGQAPSIRATSVRKPIASK